MTSNDATSAQVSSLPLLIRLIGALSLATFAAAVAFAIGTAIGYDRAELSKDSMEALRKNLEEASGEMAENGLVARRAYDLAMDAARSATELRASLLGTDGEGGEAATGGTIQAKLTLMDEQLVMYQEELAALNLRVADLENNLTDLVDALEDFNMMDQTRFDGVNEAIQGALDEIENVKEVIELLHEMPNARGRFNDPGAGGL